MTFPQDIPLIMVGPGTGVASFRSVIQERATSNQKMVLFFGCRSEQDDYYYKDEWESLQQAGADLTVITAFSRANQAYDRMYV